MATSKIYRCYFVLQVPYERNQKSAVRRTKYRFITATNPDSARDYMRIAFGKKDIKPGEVIDRIVATAWSDDRALREMGAKELPLRFD